MKLSQSPLSGYGARDTRTRAAMAGKRDGP